MIKKRLHELHWCISEGLLGRWSICSFFDFFHVALSHKRMPNGSTQSPLIKMYGKNCWVVHVQTQEVNYINNSPLHRWKCCSACLSILPPGNIPFPAKDYLFTRIKQSIGKMVKTRTRDHSFLNPFNFNSMSLLFNLNFCWVIILFVLTKRKK